MKFSHRLKHAPKHPDTGGSYKARIIGMSFRNGHVVCEWSIYTPKIRGRKVVGKGKTARKGE